METQIGKVSHFFNKVSVAIVPLVGDLSVGDTIHLVDDRRSVDFTQKVNSMQFNHESIQKGEIGTEVAVKVDQPLREGALVFKVS